MALTVDAESSITNAVTSSSTQTWSHTIGSGANRLLVIVIPTLLQGSPVRAITSVKYNNGTSATLGGSFGTGTWVTYGYIYYIKEADLPAAGTYDIVVLFDGVVENFDCGAISYIGADQTTPMENFNHVTFAAGHEPTIDITSATGDQVIAAFPIDSGANRWVNSATGTVRWGATRQGTSVSGRSFGMTQNGAATTTVTWAIWSDVDMTASTTVATEIMGMSVKAAGGGSPGTVSAVFAPRGMSQAVNRASTF